MFRGVLNSSIFGHLSDCNESMLIREQPQRTRDGGHNKHDHSNRSLQSIGRGCGSITYFEPYFGDGPICHVISTFRLEPIENTRVFVEWPPLGTHLSSEFEMQSIADKNSGYSGCVLVDLFEPFADRFE